RSARRAAFHKAFLFGLYSPGWKLSVFMCGISVDVCKEKEQEDPGSSGNDDLCHALYQKGKGTGSSGLRGIGLDPDSAQTEKNEPQAENPDRCCDRSCSCGWNISDRGLLFSHGGR